MPEASVDEQGHSPAREDQVGFAWQAFIVEPVAKSGSV